MYKNINTGYSYSDHEPVYVKFELNKESVLNKFKLKNQRFLSTCDSTKNIGDRQKVEMSKIGGVVEIYD